MLSTFSSRKFLKNSTFIFSYRWQQSTPLSCEIATISLNNLSTSSTPHVRPFELHPRIKPSCLVLYTSGVTRGWTGVDMPTPGFPRGRFSNFSKSVEKTWEGLIFIHLEHLDVQIWLLTLYFAVWMFALAKLPTVTKYDA